MSQVTGEAVRITRLGASRIVNWLGDPSTMEEGAKEEQTTDTERGEGDLPSPNQEEMVEPQ